MSSAHRCKGWEKAERESVRRVSKPREHLGGPFHAAPGNFLKIVFLMRILAFVYGAGNEVEENICKIDKIRPKQQNSPTNQYF